MYGGPLTSLKLLHRAVKRFVRRFFYENIVIYFVVCGLKNWEVKESVPVLQANKVEELVTGKVVDALLNFEMVAQVGLIAILADSKGRKKFTVFECDRLITEK